MPVGEALGKGTWRSDVKSEVLALLLEDSFGN
jgi:hypothetical protein